LNPTGSLRPGHLYIGARRGRPRTDWDWAKFNTLILDTHLVWMIFTFEFIRCPPPPILSPSSRTFVKLTLVTISIIFLGFWTLVYFIYLLTAIRVFWWILVSVCWIMSDNYYVSLRHAWVLFERIQGWGIYFNKLFP
jgi:hypothetical protein